MHSFGAHGVAVFMGYSSAAGTAKVGEASYRA
jgi:hypothetical protein